jgi:hypothetical protein
VSVLAEDPSTWLRSALQSLDGRAIGLWRIEADGLVQVCFEAPSIDPGTARKFAEATRSLGLDRLNLGIVKAASTGRVTVSLVADLPADSGSGYWLRAFDAERSVAVPLEVKEGMIGWVFSIALGRSPEASEVARILRSLASPHLATLA